MQLKMEFIQLFQWDLLMPAGYINTPVHIEASLLMYSFELSKLVTTLALIFLRLNSDKFNNTLLIPEGKLYRCSINCYQRYAFAIDIDNNIKHK